MILSRLYELARRENLLADVAFEAGYGAEAAFSRAFSRAFGAPPATWRATARRLAAAGC